MMVLGMIGVALAATTDAPAWTARYSNFANVLADKQLLARGAIPAWSFSVTPEPGGEILALAGDEQGGMRIGQVYLGRRLDLGEPLPRFLSVSLELQAACSEPDRSPPLGVMLLSASAWERLARDPAQAIVEPTWGPGELLARQAIRYPEDTVEWLPWTSRNLATRLVTGTSRQAILVLVFSGNHVGGTEWARFRRVEVTTGQTPPPAPARERQWPLKSARTLHSDAEVALARQRCQENAEATAVRERITKSCERGLAVPLPDVSWRLPAPGVPRAFNDSVAGCPVHGQEIFRRFGTYPWKIDFAKPFKLICPIGGEEYPGNDFLGYYQSGFQDRTRLEGAYADDGWGWVPEDGGERRWLVAHANHLHWQRFAIPGILDLSRAYLLTGDRRYAHICAAMLARVADVYPAMDHDTQSRYGFLNPGYLGKILNAIWETGVIESLAEAYDNVWETVDGDIELQAFRGQTGEQIRSHIETNLIEEGIRAVAERKIHGNYGMHHRSLAVLVAVRQTGPSLELLRPILDATGGEAPEEGIRFALANWLHRDGVPYETSPGYNFSWVVNLISVARLLDRAGIDLFAEPQMRRLVQWPVDLIINNRHTPAVGDSGNYRHGIVGRAADTYREAFRRWGGADFARMLQQSGGDKVAFNSYESLFEAPVQAALTSALASTPRPPPRSRALDGYGMAILNPPADTVGVQCYYGWRGGHSHNDGLAFDLYAHGQALTPDTGYGDAMNSYVAGIYTWTRATIAHNTVTVDARQQPGNQGGQVLGLAFTPTVQHVDLSAPGNYPQLSEYRRALLLVSTDDKNAYLVDVFRVAGGAQHDYSLHGTVGEVSVLRGQFSEPRAKGTLAGEDVAVGRIYDDPVLGAAGYAGVFHSYKGSGFQHLTAVRQQTDQGLVTVAVAARDQPQTRLHLHLLPQAGQTVFLAQAQISPVNQPDRLPYLVARRTGPGLHSVFVSVLDPYLDRPQVLAAEALPTAADAVALRLTRETGVDIVLLATSGGTERRAGEALVTDVAGAVIHLQPDGTLLAATAWGGSFVEVNGRRQVLRPDAIGEVTAVDLAGNAVAVRWRQESPAGTELTGQHLFLENHLRRNVFQVEAAAAEAGTTVLRLRASLVNGRGRITGLDEAARTVRSDSRFMFGACYRGMWLVNQAGDTFLPIAEFAGGGFVVDHAGRLEDVFGPAGTDGRREFRVAVAGPGDQVRLPRVTEW